MSIEFKKNLDVLISLTKQNRNPTHNFFCKIKERFAGGSTQDQQKIYEEIVSSSTIVQYGNFTAEEESAWNRLWESSSKELKR